MGSSCTKSNDRQVRNPITHQDQLVNHEFAPILSISHPFNINKKYDAISEIIREQQTGQGIKKTNAYKTTLTKQEIERKRNEFWETRTEGRSECWIALKQACSQDESEATAILSASGLKLVNKSIQITYDSEGHKYDVPIFCINEPQAYAPISKQDKYLIQEFENKQVEFKLKVVGIEKDFAMSIEANSTIQEFKEIAFVQIQKQYKRFRVFLAGREMFAHHKIGNYQLEKNTIVQAFASDYE